MRAQLPRFLSAPKVMMCLVIFVCFPEWTIKVTSVSQQKMTLFFSSRSSSSFVGLNATSVAGVLVRTKTYDIFHSFRLLSGMEESSDFSESAKDDTLLFK